MRSVSHKLMQAACASLAFTVASSAEQAALPAEKAATIPMYIGTYTGKKSQGIYLVHLNPATGALSKPELAAEMPNPSFLAISPNHQFLYACGEFGPFQGGNAIGGFSIQPDGKLKAINQQPAGGGGPCYVIVDRTGKNVLVANYGTGSVAVLQIGEDGALTPPSCIDQHQSDDPKLLPHAHCIDLDHANRFALSNDLGLNRIYVYLFDAKEGKLTANTPPFTSQPDHTGPRHLVFHPNGKFVYAINELASTVTAFHYDAEKGTLSEIQTLSTLPKGFSGPNLSTAELVIHPSGNFLYGSNRGHDSIVEYAIDGSSGKLTLVGHTPTEGKTPRGFGIDPTGQWLIAANQNSDSVVEFHINSKNGELQSTHIAMEIGSPVCVKFIDATR